MAMSFAEMDALFFEALRLYHHPVALTFLRDEKETEDFRRRCDPLVPVRPLTFCQWELAARMQGRTVLGTADRLACVSARIGFGWQEITEGEISSHMKFCRDREQTVRFLESKPRFAPGSVAAVAVSPLGKAVLAPHVVHFICDSLQAYHLACDFMAATDTHPLPTQILMSSSSCGGAVHCRQSSAFNFCTPCSGSYNAGKMERGESSVFIPGRHIEAVAGRLAERLRQTSASLTRPGDPFPGGDICKNCPLIRFVPGRAD